MQANNWNDQFRDHAWQEMRKLLDDEMPVRAIPWWRRFGWLLLLLIAFPVLGGGWWLLQNGPVNDPPTEKVEPLEMPSESVPVAWDPCDPYEDIPEPEKVVEAEPVFTAPGNWGVVRTSNRETETTPVGLTTGLNPPPENQHPGEDSADPMPAVPDRAAMIAVNTVPEISPSPLEVQAEASSTYSFPDPLGPAMQTGLLLATRANPNPVWVGGLTLRRQIGWSAVSWETGLQLGLEMRGRTFQNLALDDAEFNQDPTDTSGLTTNEATSGDYSGSSSVYFLSLEVPAGVSYRFAPAWKWQSGIRAEYVLLASQQGGGSVLANANAGNSYVFREDLSSSADPKLQRRRFGLYARTGLEWQLSPQISLGSVVELGLLDLQPALDGFQGRLGAEIQFRWYFNDPTR